MTYTVGLQQQKNDLKYTTLGWEPVSITTLSLDPVSIGPTRTKKLHYTM